MPNFHISTKFQTFTKAVALCVGLGLCSFAYADSEPKAGFVVASNSNCQVYAGDGEIQELTVKWEGDCVQGKAHGKGTAIWGNGDQYVGDYKNGKEHGYGILLLTDGTRYFGDFKDGKQHGYGTLVWANGDKYIGGWQDGKQHEKGTLIFADGSTLSGIWQNGELIK